MARALETAVCFESGTLDAMLHADTGFSDPVTNPGPPQSEQTWCAEIAPGDGWLYSEQCPNNANAYGIGFPVRVTNAGPSPTFAPFLAEDSVTKLDQYFYLRLQSGRIYLLDADGLEVDYTETGVLAPNEWHWLWVLFTAADPGDLLLIIDDIEVINATGENFHKVVGGGSGLLNVRFTGQGAAPASPTTVYVPNVIIFSGCTGKDDLLRRYFTPCYYAPLATGVPNIGQTLDSGLWSDCFAEIPFSKANYGAYTHTGYKGIVTTNSGLGIPGPYGDARIRPNDTIIGAGWVWLWYNESGPSARFYGHWGKCPHTDPNTDYTTSEWFLGINDHRTLRVSQNSSYVPTRSDHFQMGMRASDLDPSPEVRTYDMLAYLLVQRGAREVNLGCGVGGRPQRDVLVG